MTPTSRPIAFFDLDGTLTDSREGIVRSIAHALAELGAEVPGERDLEALIGPPLRKTFGNLIPEPTPERIERAVEAYRSRYRTKGLYEATVYDGITEALRSLVPEWQLFVVTAKPHAYARTIVRHFDLERYFDDIYGAELDGTRDDKAELIAHILAELTIDPSRVVMIGDREHDVKAAAAHGIPTIGVTFGFGTEAELLASGAVALCAGASEIPRMLPLALDGATARRF